MNSGKKTVSTAAQLLRGSALTACVLMLGSHPAGPRFELPPGFELAIYAQDLEHITGIDMRADGTVILTRSDPRDRYEITPAHDDEPISVRRVAAELAPPDPALTQVADTQTGARVQFEWHPDSGELTLQPGAAQPLAGRDIPSSPATLRLARTLATHPHTDVTLAPDDTLFVADTRAGIVYRVGAAR